MYIRQLELSKDGTHACYFVDGRNDFQCCGLL